MSAVNVYYVQTSIIWAQAHFQVKRLEPCRPDVLLYILCFFSSDHISKGLTRDVNAPQWGPKLRNGMYSWAFSQNCKNQSKHSVMYAKRTRTIKFRAVFIMIEKNMQQYKTARTSAQQKRLRCNSHFWGTPRQQSEPWHWRRASFHWFPCRFPP